MEEIDFETFAWRDTNTLANPSGPESGLFSEFRS